MKKLMFAVAALAAGVACAEITSANVVGYQQKSFDRNFNYICGTFAPVADVSFTLGDIDASDDFFNSSLQFLTPDGATAKVSVEGLGEVYATYKFWWAEDTVAGVRGWYLEDDTEAAYPQNDRVINSAEAFCIDHADTEPDCYLTFAGQVLTNEDKELTLSFDRNFNYVGNFNPATITLGDIDASDDFFNSSLQFLTPDGATAKVAVEGLGEVYATYKFWWAEDTVAGVRGWYLEDDTEAVYPQNDRMIEAGEAFCIDHADTEPDCTITIPTAL